MSCCCLCGDELRSPLNSVGPLPAHAKATSNGGDVADVVSLRARPVAGVVAMVQ